MRKKANIDDTIPAVIPNEVSSREFRQNWARLIQKVYEVDPLLCPKCQGTMTRSTLRRMLPAAQFSYSRMVSPRIPCFFTSRSNNCRVPVPLFTQTEIDHRRYLGHLILDKKEIPIL